MIQSNQYAEFGGTADGKKNQKEQMKLMRDQDIKEMQVPGNNLIKSTK
jgi:hypothetical protein